MIIPRLPSLFSISLLGMSSAAKSISPNQNSKRPDEITSWTTESDLYGDLTRSNKESLSTALGISMPITFIEEIQIEDEYCRPIQREQISSIDVGEIGEGYDTEVSEAELKKLIEDHKSSKILVIKDKLHYSKASQSVKHGFVNLALKKECIGLFDGLDRHRESDVIPRKSARDIPGQIYGLETDPLVLLGHFTFMKDWAATDTNKYKPGNILDGWISAMKRKKETMYTATIKLWELLDGNKKIKHQMALIDTLNFVADNIHRKKGDFISEFILWASKENNFRKFGHYVDTILKLIIPLSDDPIERKTENKLASRIFNPKTTPQDLISFNEHFGLVRRHREWLSVLDEAEIQNPDDLLIVALIGNAHYDKFIKDIKNRE
ncbi:hypothetical protein HOG98_03865 [bacterium]|jgi:hypothetical protein|nr:hypothetical protein [bacterium]